jgi:hypothetical protein
VPANLTAQYKAAEERYRKAVGHEEKLDALREMLALLPKHKGTEKLQADLRKRLSKLEDESAHVAKSGHRGPDAGHVRREGAGQWACARSRTPTRRSPSIRSPRACRSRA